MPLDLTDAELATAATACRAMVYQEGERAKHDGVYSQFEFTARSAIFNFALVPWTPPLAVSPMA